MQDLINSFRADLDKRYGPSACEVEVLVKRFLGLWDKCRRAFYSPGRSLMVLAVNDPAYAWSDYVVRRLVVEAIAEKNDDCQSSWGKEGFVFPVICSPNADGSSILRLIAEALKGCSPQCWAHACAVVSLEYVLEGSDQADILERQIWSALSMINDMLAEGFDESVRDEIARVMSAQSPDRESVDKLLSIGDRPENIRVSRECVDDDGQAYRVNSIVRRSNHLPVFAISVGENLSSSAVYQLQDLALRCECRFLILVNVEDEESLEHQFGGGAIPEEAYDVLGFEEAIANVENVVAAEMEASHFLGLMEEWYDAEIRGEDSGDFGVPFSLASSIINALGGRESC